MCVVRGTARGLKCNILQLQHQRIVGCACQQHHCMHVLVLLHPAGLYMVYQKETGFLACLPSASTCMCLGCIRLPAVPVEHSNTWCLWDGVLL